MFAVALNLGPVYDSAIPSMEYMSAFILSPVCVVFDYLVVCLVLPHCQVGYRGDWGGGEDVHGYVPVFT